MLSGPKWWQVNFAEKIEDSLDYDDPITLNRVISKHEKLILQCVLEYLITPGKKHTIQSVLELISKEVPNEQK